MADNKKYYWLRLKNNFFKQKEIKKLRRIAGGDTYTVIYLKLQLLSLTTDGKLYFDGIEDTFVEEISLELDEDVENVRMTLLFLEKYSLIVQVESDEYLLPETLECIGKETASTQRSRKSREKKKTKLLQCNTNATECNTEIEIEKEIEIEIEIENRDISSSSSEEVEEEEFSRSEDSILEVMRLCQKIKFKLKKTDAKQFIDIYGIDKVKQALISVSYSVADIKSPSSYLAATLQDMARDKKVDITIKKESKKSNFSNYKQRDHDEELVSEILNANSGDWSKEN